ncbi:MAG: response regulator [Myxococcales bacterium]
MTHGLRHDTRTAHILYVGDAEGGGEVLATLQSHGDHEVTAVGDEAAALAAVDARAFDLVVLDLAGPEGSVSELIRQLRAHRSTASAGILDLTHDEGRARGYGQLEGGADAQLAHPVDARAMTAQVDALLRIRRAERNARSLARDWVATFDAITDAIAVLSREGRIVRCNRAALRVMGCSRARAIGGDYRQVWAGATDALPPDLPAVGRATGPFSIEVTFGGRWYRLAVDPIEGRDDPDGGDVVIVLTDITDIKRFEHELRVQTEQLQRHNRRQTDFLGLLAHELRNPLAAIGAAANAIADAGLEAAEKQLGALSIVRRQVHNLARMVDDLLDMARITEDKIALRREPVDLRACVQAAADAVRPAAEHREHSLRVEAGEQPIFAKVDRTRIEQLLANLLDNAVKYTEPGGEITIGLEPDPDAPQELALLTVRDTGVGMPPDRLSEAFEMFVQYERTLDRAEGGLGLGLTLVRRLAELHGGTVTAHSAGTGLGTTFEVRLPRMPAARPRTPRVSEAPRPNRAATRRVLLVEDNADLRQLLAFKLRRAGHEVSEAATGPEGATAAERERPDTIVLDVGLPGMDGYDLARMLRSRQETRDCHLIALTGYGSDRDRRGAEEAGFDVHLVKPVDFERFIELVSRGRE